MTKARQLIKRHKDNSTVRALLANELGVRFPIDLIEAIRVSMQTPPVGKGEQVTKTDWQVERVFWSGMEEGTHALSAAILAQGKHT
jgi:hypothetical protein